MSNDQYMIDMVFFGRSTLIFIRALGILTSIDFYLRNRDEKFLYFFFGWLSGLLATFIGIIPESLVLDPLIEDTTYFINMISTYNSFLLIVVGFYCYFHNIRPKKSLSILATTNIFLLVIFLLFGLSVVNTVSFILNAIVGNGLLFLYLIDRKKIKIYARQTLPWFYIIFIVSVSSMIILSPILNDESNIVHIHDEFNSFFVMFSGIINFLLMLLISIHLEFSMNLNIKEKLKDKYSHDLGNNLQALYSAIEIIEKVSPPESKSLEYVDVSRKKIEEASDLIKKIRNL